MYHFTEIRIDQSVSPLIQVDYSCYRSSIKK